MKEGIKFGVGCMVGMCIGACMIVMAGDVLGKMAEKCDEKGGE